PEGLAPATPPSPPVVPAAPAPEPRSNANPIEVARARSLEASVRAELRPFADGAGTRVVVEIDTIGVPHPRHAESLSPKLVAVAESYERLGLAGDVRRVLDANDAL